MKDENKVPQQDNTVAEAEDKTAENIENEEETLLSAGDDNIPESFGGYRLTFMGQTADAEQSEGLAKFAKSAHEAQLTGAQTQKMLDMYESLYLEHLEKTEDEKQKGIDALKNEWQDDFDTRVKKASKAAKHFGGQDFLNFLDETGLGDSPELIKVFEKIAETVADDRIIDTKKTKTDRKSPSELLFGAE